MIPITDCKDEIDHIKEQLQKAIDNIDLITDEDLKRRIKDRLEKSGAIECECDCEDPDELGYNRPIFFFFWKIGAWPTIHLCKNNIERFGDEEDIWQIILHEFAHSACWDHWGNKGVPGDDGELEEYEEEKEGQDAT